MKDLSTSFTTASPVVTHLLCDLVLPCHSMIYGVTLTWLNLSDIEYVFMFDKDWGKARETKSITTTIKHPQGKIQFTGLKIDAKICIKKNLASILKKCNCRHRRPRLTVQESQIFSDTSFWFASVGFESQTMWYPLAYPTQYYSVGTSQSIKKDFCVVVIPY